VTAVREPKRDGYAAVQLAFGDVKEGKLTRAEEGHTKKAGVPPRRHLVEFRDEDLGAKEAPKIGDEVTVASFEAGEKVKVSGVSIGKGFQGGIKRHNFSRGPVSHGSHNVRAPGSIGASAFPARVFKGMRMPGQMGNRRVTQRGLEIADVDAERNYLFHDLDQTEDLAETFVVDDFHKIREGKNGGGDPWHTDGRLFVGVIGAQ